MAAASHALRCKRSQRRVLVVVPVGERQEQTRGVFVVFARILNRVAVDADISVVRRDAPIVRRMDDLLDFRHHPVQVSIRVAVVGLQISILFSDDDESLNPVAR